MLNKLRVVLVVINTKKKEFSKNKELSKKEKRRRRYVCVSDCRKQNEKTDEEG